MNFDFEAVLFDMDGTIADTTVYHNQAWIEFAQAHLGEALNDDDRRFVPGRTRDIIRSILGREVSPQQADLLHDDKELRFQALARGRIQPLPGLQDYINVLKENGVRTGLVTNAPRMNVVFTLRELDLAECFEFALCAEDIVCGKPDPAPFREACRQLGVKPTNALVHEDSEMGITSALLAGCPVAAILTGMSRETATRLGTKWAFESYTEWMEFWKLK